jgi:hypothetical protein
MRAFLPGWRRLGAAVAAAFVLACAVRAAEPDFVPPADLLAAAKKEGKIVLYTANFLDSVGALDPGSRILRFARFRDDKGRVSFQRWRNDNGRSPRRTKGRSVWAPMPP